MSARDKETSPDITKPEGLRLAAAQGDSTIAQVEETADRILRMARTFVIHRATSSRPPPRAGSSALPRKGV